MSDKIALYIDIEGFSKTFESGGKHSFIKLTNTLYKLGRTNLENHSIIQYGGDGFLIMRQLRTTTRIKPFIELAVILLQSILTNGSVGRVQISTGYMQAISGLYSDEIQAEINSNHQNVLTNSRYNGMYINPISGTSIINCYNLKGPKGPLLLIDENLTQNLIKEKIPYSVVEKNGSRALSINWINYKSEYIDNSLKLIDVNNNNIEYLLENYVYNNTNLAEEWRKNALRLLNK